jgi:hypothetical protein
MEERIYVSLSFPRLQQHGCPTQWCDKHQCWYFKNYKTYQPYETYMHPFRVHFVPIKDEQIPYAQRHCPSMFYDKTNDVWNVNDKDLQKLLDMFQED